jgi:hypothetical protein
VIPDRSTWPQALQERPVCPVRGLPAPFIAEVQEDGRVLFTVLDPKRSIRCVQERLCAMCGGPLGDGPVALIGDVASLEPDGFHIEPPVHERCAELAVGGLCPFLSHERVPRRPLPEGVNVVGGGRAELPHIGRAIAKRPPVIVVAEDYVPGMWQGDQGDCIVYRAVKVIRVRFYRYENDLLVEIEHPLLADPPRPLSEAERSRWKAARRQPRRRPRSKR